MPLDSTMNVTEIAVQLGAFVAAAAMNYVASVHTLGKDKERPAAAQQRADAFLSGFAGLIVVTLVIDYVPLRIGVDVAMIIAGLVGFAYGPSALTVLANIGRQLAAARLRVEIAPPSGVQPTTAQPPPIATAPPLPLPTPALVEAPADPASLSDPTPSAPDISAEPTGGTS